MRHCTATAVARHLRLAAADPVPAPCNGWPCAIENLRAHQIDAGDDFRDGVLHLDARVHLDEEPFVRVEIVEEFHRAGVVVTDLARQCSRRLRTIRCRTLRFESHRRRDLDHFLVAALHGAIALVQMQHVAMAVAQHLHLDVLGARNVFFQETPPDCRTRGRLRLRASSSKIGRDRRPWCTTRMPRPPPPNAALMMSGKPISLAIFNASARSSTGSSVPGRVGTPTFWASARAATLSPINSQQFRARPDKRDAGVRAGLGKLRVLGKKSVAGMNEIHALFLGQRDDAGDVEIRADRPLAFADEIRFVRLEPMDRKGGLPARKSRPCAGPVRSPREKRGWRFRCGWRPAIS